MAYPPGGMKKGTNFQAAAFSVNELKDANTQPKCQVVAEPPPHGTFHTETINGVKFNVAEIDGVATGNLMDGYVYRTFHKGKCYELDIRIAFSNIGNYDPGTVKNFDSERVSRALKAVLASFKFLR
jgi:hypothetical protein